MKAKLKLSALGTLNLHTCESAVPLSLEGASVSMLAKYGEFENTILAQRVNELFFAKGQYVVVTGYKGSVFTDSDGNSRILKEGKTEKNYKSARNAAETTSAKRVVEAEYLLTPEASRASYGRDELLSLLSLTETCEGELTEDELREQYDEYVEWLSREQDDEPSSEERKPNPHMG